MPAWVKTAYVDYEKRLRGWVPAELIEIAPAKRAKSYSDAQALQYKKDEGSRILSALKPRETLICLEVTGKALSTEDLADNLSGWMAQGGDVALVIGGADGMSDELLAQASAKISLSKLTLPHQLVRVVLIEQIYRAMSLINNHPYHRV